MKKVLLNLIFLLIVFNSYCQEKLDIKRIGFSIDIPKNWTTIPNDEILKNLNNFEFTDEQMDHLFKTNNSTVNLATFVKYDPKTHAGIIPTIKIRTRESKVTNLQDFLKQIQNSNEELKKTLDDFKFIDNPTLVELSRKKVVKFSVQFHLKKDGHIFTICSRSYYIPKNGYYISLNFIEEIGKEDNSLLFENLIKTISLTDK